MEHGAWGRGQGAGSWELGAGRKVKGLIMFVIA